MSNNELTFNSRQNNTVDIRNNFNQISIAETLPETTAAVSDLVLGQHTLGDEPLGVYEKARLVVGGRFSEIDINNRIYNEVSAFRIPIERVSSEFQIGSDVLGAHVLGSFEI